MTIATGLAAALVIALAIGWLIRAAIIGRNRGLYEVREIRDFLSAEECDHLISLAGPLIRDSPVIRDGQNRSSALRKSSSAFFTDSRDPVVLRIKQRVAEASATDLRSQEPLQVTHYRTGEFYASHRDATGITGSPLDEAGDREATMIMYLNDDFAGGYTRFPKIGARIAPERGKAVFFKNLADDGLAPHPLSVHLATPVRSGEKWLLNQWIRQKPLPTLNRSERRARAKGKR